MDAEEWVEENQGNMLVSLGIVSYIYECLRDEKSRLGADFTWGIEVDRNAIIEPGQEIIIDVSAEVEKMREGKQEDESEIQSEVEFISRNFDFMEDLEAWQRYIAYLTFGLNLIFLLWLLIWCCCRCKCCCGSRAAEIRKF